VADEAQLVRFVAQLLFREYAFFRSDDGGAGGAAPPTRGAESDVMYAWALCEPLVTRRAVLSRRFDLSSYAAGRLGLGPVRTSAGAATYGHGIDRPLAAGTIARRLRKLARDPKRFLEESRVPSLRWLGRRIPR
jgi:hypothetical protein